MSPFEQQLKETLSRHGRQPLPRDVAWTEVTARMQRAERTRRRQISGLSTAALVIAMIGITVAVPRMNGGAASLSDFAGGARDAGTFKMRMEIRGQGPDGEQQNGLFEAEFDLERKRAYLKQTATSGSGGDAAGGPGGPSGAEMILIEDTSYMRFDGLFPGVREPEKEWIRIPLPEGANPFLDGDSPLAFLFPVDPGNYFDLVHEAATEVKDLGPSEVRGEPATEYAVTIDLERLREGATDAYAEALDRMIEEIGPEFPMHIWIGNDGLLYKQTYSFVMTEEGTVEAVAEFYDYGEPVDIEPPPDDEVAESFDEYRKTDESPPEGGSGVQSCSTTSDGVTECRFEDTGTAVYDPCSGRDACEPTPAPSCPSADDGPVFCPRTYESAP